MIIAGGLSTYYPPRNLDILHEGGGASPPDEEMQRESSFGSRSPEAMPLRCKICARREDAVRAIAFRILIVDGNSGLTRGLSHLLRVRGFRVQYAHTGVAALKVAHAFQPEFALVEASLPDLSGYEVAALLPGVIDPVRRLKIASVSGGSAEEDLSFSQAAGCVSHLRKPVKIAQIEALLAGAWSSLNSPLA